ncbi:MAG: hypothetical protein LC655_07795, partial [Bacteroidales bacterium]|nr:hypothetical protein [Bacteroidales bacterium]
MITGGISERTLVWRLVQDHVRKELLFAATEFGVWFTIDGGEKWTRMKGGLPTISFRDITIQRRESDLVAASFGRGFFILDDITPLREFKAEMIEKEALLFPVKDALLFQPRGVTVSPGNSEYRADNPPPGAVFTYYLKEDMKSLKELRKKSEKELNETESDIPFPGWDALEMELKEDDPFLVVTVKDAEGKVVNHVKAPAKKGIRRISWDLRYTSQRGLDPDEGSEELKVDSRGFMVPPGNYTATLFAVQKGEMKQMTDAVGFAVKPLYEGVLEPVSTEQREQFRKELEAAMLDYAAVQKALKEAQNRVQVAKNACFRMEQDAGGLLDEIYRAEAKLAGLDEQLNGKKTKSEVGEKQENTPGMRFSVATRGLSTTYGPTPMHKESLQTGIEELQPLREQLKE